MYLWELVLGTGEACGQFTVYEDKLGLPAVCFKGTRHKGQYNAQIIQLPCLYAIMLMNNNFPQQ